MGTRQSKLRITLAILITLSLSIGVFATPAGAAPPKPKVSWSPCYRETGFPYECGTVQAPLDYDNPGVAAITIALIRLPASDPAHRIGSLFLNPGGPGGSGFDFALFAGPYLYTPEVRARFDIVGFDPRGIGRSATLRCFGNPRQWTPYFTPFSFPMTPEEETVWEAADRYLVDACTQRGSRMIDHMTTANVARDLDLLRQAVGDGGLTYAGYSYGTYLGVTYANLFPDKVRALVVDGVLDPIAWSTGAPGLGSTIPFSTRLRSDQGALATLNEFFRLCDAGGQNCPFAPDSSNRFAALAAQLRLQPLFVTFPDGSIAYVTYQDLISNALSAMYDSYSWTFFADFLAAIESLASPAELGSRLQALWMQLGFITKRGFPQYPNALEGFSGVACSDSDNPDNYDAWWAASLASEAQYGYFGPLWTYFSSICAAWPGDKSDRYVGPFNRTTANPVLVANTLYDPATRYQGAVTVAGLLPNSRLLTVNGWGHTTLFTSQCADQAVAAYLLDGTLPAPGLVCNADYVPFAQPSPSAATLAAASARARITPVMVPDIVRRNVR